MTFLLHAGLLFTAIAIAGIELRWIARKSRGLGLIFGIGLALRLVSASAVFAISYYGLGIFRDLQMGGGFWTLGADAPKYFEAASHAAATQPSSILWSSASPAYTIALAWWLKIAGISVFKAILFNIGCYMATAAAVVAGANRGERAPSDAWTPLVLGAFTFSPILVLTGTQVLKDPFFAMLIALSCRCAFVMFDLLKRPGGTRGPALASVLSACCVLVAAIGGVRPYFAVFQWVAFAAALAALIVAKPSSVLPLTRRALLALPILAALWVAFAIGAGPTYTTYMSAFASAGVESEIQTKREGFVEAGGATNMATAPVFSGNRPGGPRPVEVQESRVRHLATGLLAIFVPMSVLRALSLVTFSGGRGLLAIADLDTIFLDGILIAFGMAIIRRRPPVLSNAATLTFVGTLGGISTVLLAYVVTNFGTLLRLRLLAAGAMWFVPLAFGPRLRRPAPARIGDEVPVRGIGRASAEAGSRTARQPRSVRVSALLGVGAFAAWIVLPGAPDSVFSGTPITALELGSLTAGLLVVGLVALVRPRRPLHDGWILAFLLLMIVKPVLAIGTSASGWRGVYEILSHSQVSAPLSFTSGLSNRQFRIDRDIDFDGPGFALPTAGQVTTTSGRSSGVPPEEEFPMRAHWSRFVELERDGPLTWSVRCHGYIAIEIDGKQISPFTRCTDAAMVVTTSTVSRGIHKLVVHYGKEDRLRPLAVVRAASPSTEAAQFAPGLGRRNLRLTIVSTIAGWIVCGLFAVGIGRIYWPSASSRRFVRGWPSRSAALGVFTVLLALTFRTMLHYGHAIAPLLADDAALRFENGAQAIMAAGPFGSLGYPLYAQALALAHMLLGAGPSAAAFLNLVCLASIVPMGWWIGWRHLQTLASASAPVLMGLFCGWYAWGFALTAHDDLFFLAASFLAFGTSARALKSGTWVHWLTAIAAAAAAIAIRPIFATYPVLLLSLVAAGRERRHALIRGRLSGGMTIALAAFVLAQVAVALVSGHGRLTERAGVPLEAAVLLAATLLLPRHAHAPDAAKPYREALLD